MAKLVAKTYGDALFELALEENCIDTLVEETEGVLKLFEENAELNKLMNHPKISKEEKICVMEEIFKGRVSEELAGFIRIIVSKDRYGEITQIFEYFIARVKEHKNIGTAYVISAVELKPAQKETIKNKLLSITRYSTIEMVYSVDKELIGGMMIRIGDRIIDSSIKTKIYEMSKSLSKIQL